MAGAEAESGVAALCPATAFAALDGDALSPRTTVPTALAADPKQDEEVAAAAPVPAPTPPPPPAAAASPIEPSLHHLRSAGTLDSLDPHADPDAQATVTDYLDFTEHLPADVARSLILIGKLDRTHAEQSRRVHELTTLWGQLPSVPPEERPSGVQLRADISRYMHRGVRSRLYSAAEAVRANDNVTRHYHRSRAIAAKLREMLENYPSAEEQQQQQQQRSPATAAKSPRAARPPRLALWVGEGGVGGERVRTRRVPRIMVPGEVLAPWELDFDSLSDDDDDDDRNTDTDREHDDLDSQANSDRDIKTPVAQPRIKVVKQSQQPKKKKKDGGRRAGSGSQRARQGPKSGLSASQALVKLMMNPPPENAVPGSSDAPWLQLTPWELARLRKRMKKNAEWNPSETMIARELKNLGRGVEAYRDARRLAEEEGRTFPSVTQTLDSDGTGTIRESMDTNDLLMSNRGMRLNEAKKIKREAMAKQAAEEAEESARKMQELGQMMMGGAAAPSALAGGSGAGSGPGPAGPDPPKEALPKPRSKSKSTGKRKREPEEATDNANEPDRSVAARPDVKRTRTETPVPPPNLSFGGGGSSSSANAAAATGTGAGVGGGPHGHTETPVLPPQVPLPQAPLPQVPVPQVPVPQVPVPPTALPAPAPVPPGPVPAAISNTRASVRVLPGSPQQECAAPVPAALEPALEPTAFAALAASTVPTAPPAPAPNSAKPSSSSPSPSPAPAPAPAPPTMLATTTVTTTTTVPTKPPAETPIPPPVVPPPPPPPPPPPTRRETRGEAAKKSQQQQQQGQGQGQGQSRMSPKLASPSLPMPSSLPPPPQAASSRVTTPRTTPGPESAPNPPATAPTPSRRPPSRGKAGTNQDPAQSTLASDRTRRVSTTRNTPAPAEPPVRERRARRGRKPAPGVVGKTRAGGASRAVVKRKAAPRRKKKDRGAQQMMESELEEVDDDGNPIDPNEPRYCLCNSVSYGTMIYCEGDCQCEWYHFECVGLKENETPEDSWYCADCRARGLDQSDDDDSSSESGR